MDFRKVTPDSINNLGDMLLKARCVSILYVITLLSMMCLKYVVAQKNQEVEDNSIRGYTNGSAFSFTQSTAQYGYESEEHTVVTKDGYIITIFRIPRGKYCKGPIKRTPVLLQHGLFLSSDCWTDGGPLAGLAFLISDACYDLWLGNQRGNFYGRRHVVLDPDLDSQFWEFSSEEMGRYDLPATIDYILNNTGSSKVNYVGYSLGCAVGYIMCSETWGYCEKIGVFVNLAPATRMKYTRSIPLRSLVEFYAAVEPNLTLPLELEVAPEGGFIQRFGALSCQDPIVASTACRKIVSIIDSYDPGSIETRTLQVLFNHFPVGTSARTLASMGQNMIEGGFQKYNYGPKRNLEMYGSTTPPIYKLNRTAIPVVIFYGHNDFLVDPRDVHWLITQLPNVVEGSPVRRKTWNHFDVPYSRYAKVQIFDRVNVYLEKYSET